MAEAISRSHKWVGATHVTLDDKQAKWAAHRGSFRVPEATKVDVLEVYCDQCKRVFEDVFPHECIAAQTTEHLRGGPIGERQKRTHPHHDCDRYNCNEPLPVGFTRRATSAG